MYGLKIAAVIAGIFTVKNTVIKEIVKEISTF